MTIRRVKPTGWPGGSSATLSSSEINAIDTNITRALDRTPEGDVCFGAIQLSGAGRVIPSVTQPPTSSASLSVGSANYYQLTSSHNTNVTYTLSNTGATTGDILTFFADAAFVRVATIVADSVTLFEIGNSNAADGPWASFIYLGGWRLYQHSRGSRMRTDEFTVSGTWTCPRGVTSVLLYGYGGGGAGGSSGVNINGTYTMSPNALSGPIGGMGGGGGGGALASWVNVAVTAGNTYAVTIGAGGVWAVNGNTTNNGQTTSFGTLASFVGATGGCNGVSHNTSTSASSLCIPIGGSPFQFWKQTYEYGNSYGAGSTSNTFMLTANDLRREYTTQMHFGGCGGSLYDFSQFIGNNLNAPTYTWTFAAIIPRNGGDSFASAGGQRGNSFNLSVGAVMGGGGGGAGPGGSGGAGGNGNASGAPNNGTSAANNTGAGGGGAGAGTSGYGTGGAGGSGKLIIHYVK